MAISKVFEPLYLNYEPELLREIEKQKARDAVRIWIRQKLNCLDDHFRCGRDERGMLERVTQFRKKPSKPTACCWSIWIRSFFGRTNASSGSGNGPGNPVRFCAEGEGL